MEELVTSTMPVEYSQVPDFDNIPPVEGMPEGTAWKVWNTRSGRDNYGTLNLLTPDVVLVAKSEIQTGESVALNWQMQNIRHPAWTRKPLEIKSFTLPGGYLAHDDEIAINTQATSQWDGFKHWGHQSTGRYYNNLKHEDVTKTTENGIHHWSDRGGIVARGILLDYVAHAKRKGICFSAWDRHVITLTDLEGMIAYQNLTLRPGDILIVRCGFVKQYNESTEEERIAGIANNANCIGIEGCEEMIRWLWNNHFAAMACDAMAMEQWPPNEEWIIHDYSLALWGMPIGELWDLESLARKCEKEQRWSFFFTSAPLNVVGGIASPPNALAIF